MTGDMKTSRKAVWKEDVEMPGWAAVFFKMTLFAFGPKFYTVERWTGAANNATENEPYFLALAAAYSASGIPLPSWAETSVWVFTASRCVHAIVYLNGDLIPQPTRGLCYTVSLCAMMALAASALAA